MHYKLFQTAEQQLVDIAKYTDKKWGRQQATIYIKNLYQTFQELSQTPSKWRRAQYKKLKNVFYYQYEKHFIFFISLPSEIRIISVLHQRMDMPRRVLKDLDETVD